ARPGTVSLRGKLSIRDTNAQANVVVRLTTSRGQLRVTLGGVKTTGNRSRALTLSGPLVRVNKVLASLSLLLGPGHGRARVSVSASDGAASNQGAIVVLV